MASPRDLTGVRLWWSADAPATIVDGRVTEAPDLITGAVAARFGQGRVGPERITVGDRPAWRFGGSASPASLLTPDVPAVTSAPYAWAFVLTPLAGYAGQAIAPGPNSAVTSSSAQLLTESSGSFRWSAFAGTSLTTPLTPNTADTQLVIVEHDGATGATRLYVTGQGSVRATLQRRSLAGQQHIGRHGSNDRPLHADVRAIVLIDRALTDADVTTLEQWRSEGASSSDTPIRATVTVRPATVRSRATATTARRRTTSTTARTTVRASATTRARRDVFARAAVRVLASATTTRTAATATPATVIAAASATTTRAASPDVAPAPVTARTRVRTTARRNAASAATVTVGASARTVARRAVLAVATVAVTASATTRTVRRTAARAIVRLLASATVTSASTLPPSTGRDIRADVGDPHRGWDLDEPARGWTFDLPRSAWTFGRPHR